jgi:DNA-binding response OmpR family regulator
MEADQGLVVCVGMPLRHVGELAKVLRDRAVVVATPDVDGALTLLREDRAADDDPWPAARDARHTGAVVEEPDPDAPITIGLLRIAPAAREVSVGGTQVHLSAQEFDLLVALASDAGRVWSFEDLTARVWRTGYLGDREHLNSAIKRLRRRLATPPGVHITSVRGVGYRLRISHESAIPAPLAEALRRHDLVPMPDGAAEDAA